MRILILESGPRERIAVHRPRMRVYVYTCVCICEYIYIYEWLSKLWSFLARPRCCTIVWGPKRDHNFDNHPYVYYIYVRIYMLMIKHVHPLTHSSTRASIINTYLEYNC